MNLLKRYTILRRITGILLGVFLCCMLKGEKSHAKEPLVIIIDPGHGGENLGAEYGEYTEKYLNMTVAVAMKEELEKYEGVTVHLTHESPEDDMSLEERAAFAREKDGDYLFCLHFNMSVNHNLFGAEVWVSAFDSYYAKGYAYAQILMEMFTDAGLYSRGIKTRINDKGDNYYGILRHATNEGIPAVLIEHCHLDQENDKPFYTEGEEQWKEFGRMDATAAAKYFRLRSEELGVDYSNYEVPEVKIPSSPVKPDKTEPDICELELVEVDEEKREATLLLRAQDFESYILYYAYSLNGGNSYSDLQKWNKDENSVTFTVSLPPGEDVEIRGNAYNGFDVWKESNIIKVEAIPVVPPEEVPVLEERQMEVMELPPVESLEELEGEFVFDAYSIGLAVLISFMILCILILLSRILLLIKLKKKA